MEQCRSTPCRPGRSPILDKSIDWRDYLYGAETEEFRTGLQRHQRTGRPFGGLGFVEELELLLDRELKPKKPGPKPDKGGS